jgi:hypothetical protein
MQKKRRPRPSPTRAESIRRSWQVNTIRQRRVNGVRSYQERVRAALAAQRGDALVAT